MAIESKLNSTTQSYIYPMANSVSGGEDHSEYNIVRSLGNILFYSAATTEMDFIDTGVEFSLPGKFYVSTNGGSSNCNGYLVKCSQLENVEMPLEIKTEIESNVSVNKVLDFEYYLGEYKNLYAEDVSIFKNAKLNLTYDLYLSIDYSNTIASGVSLKFLISDSSLVSSGKSYDLGEDYIYNLEDLYSKSYEPLGFSDIGLYLGSIVLHTILDENGGFDYVGSDLNMSNDPFQISDHLTRCIDLDRLGSDNYSLLKYLALNLEELYKLNVYGGNLYVSNRNNPSDTRQDQISDFGGDYRLQISSNYGSDQYPDQHISTLDLVKFNSAITNEKVIVLKNLLKFIGEPSEDNYNSVTVEIGNDATETIIKNVKNLMAGTVEIEEVLKTNSISTKSGDNIGFDDKNLKGINTINATKVYGAVWN